MHVECMLLMSSLIMVTIPLPSTPLRFVTVYTITYT
jgi:hypothetical protein